MKDLKIISIISIIIGVVLILFSFKLPVPNHVLGGAIGFRISLSLDILIACLDIGAAALFLYGLKYFKPQLKFAYILICLGIIFFGLANIQLPIFQMLNGFNSKWITTGGIQLLYFISAIFMYFGIRHFAQLIEIKSIFNSTRWVFATLIVIGCIFAAISYTTHSPENIYGISIGLTALNSAFLLISVILVFKLKSKAGPSFTNVLAWFIIAQFFGALAIGQVVIFQLIGFDNLWVNAGFFSMIYIINGILLQKSGHAFNQIAGF